MRSAERPTRRWRFPRRMTASVRNVRLTVAYDGTDFHGFAINGELRTVLGELTAAVDTRRAHPGRTDRAPAAPTPASTGGARSSPVCFPTTPTCGRLQRSVNGLCGPEIAVRVGGVGRARLLRPVLGDLTLLPLRRLEPPRAEPARGAHFVARARPARSRRDERGGRACLIGEHDFSSFCRRPNRRPGLNRAESRSSRHDAEWSLVDTHLGADHPVRDRRHVVLPPDGAQHRRHARRRRPRRRSTTGIGRRTLAALDRSAAGPVAPPHGLVLWDVDYRGTRWNV